MYGTDLRTFCIEPSRLAKGFPQGGQKISKKVDFWPFRNFTSLYLCNRYWCIQADTGKCFIHPLSNCRMCMDPSPTEFYRGGLKCKWRNSSFGDNQPSTVSVFLSVVRCGRVCRAQTYAHHMLRGSASTVLTATSQVNGRWRILTTHRIETHEPTATKSRRIDYVRERTPYTKFGTNPSTGGFWAYGWNITFLWLSLFIYTFFSETRVQVRPVDGFLRAIAH